VAKYIEQLQYGDWEVIRKDRYGEILIEAKCIGKDEEGDNIVLIRSKGCTEKERGIHQRLLERAEGGLRKLEDSVKKGRLKDESIIQRRIGAIFARYPGTSRWISTTLISHKDDKKRYVRWSLRQDRLEEVRQLEGCYTLRTNMEDVSGKSVWEMYSVLEKVEEAFRMLKHDLKLRPIFHKVERRVEAHILFTVLAYSMGWALEREHRQRGGDLSLRRLIEKLHRIELGTITMRTVDGKAIELRRISTPGREEREILRSLNLELPQGTLDLGSIKAEFL
jgi:transposase